VKLSKSPSRGLLYHTGQVGRDPRLEHKEVILISFSILYFQTLGCLWGRAVPGRGNVPVSRDKKRQISNDIFPFNNE